VLERRAGITRTRHDPSAWPAPLMEEGVAEEGVAHDLRPGYGETTMTNRRKEGRGGCTRIERTRVPLLLLVVALLGCTGSMDPRFDGTEIRIVVVGEGTGSGRVTGPALNCALASGDSCSEEFIDAGAGGAFRLEAMADSGSAFAGWSGDCTGEICSLSFPQGKDTTFDVRVRFERIAEPNLPPSVEVFLPEDGATYQAGDSVSFLGSGTDPEDGTLSGLAGQLLWTSSVSGSLCTCTSFRSVLAVGSHTISLIATDTEGARDTARVTVTVNEASTPGSISGRVTGNGYAVGGATLTLSGAGSATTASDDGGFYSFANLAPGTYTVTVSVALSITFPAPAQTVTVGSGQAVVVNFVGMY
jgi:hypothetical protein